MLDNTESEFAVLSGILKYGNDIFSVISHGLEESTFTKDENKVLYSCLNHALSFVDKITISDVISSATSLGLLEYLNQKQLPSLLKDMLHSDIPIHNIEHHAKKIRRIQFAKTLQDKIKGAYKSLDNINGDEPLDTILSLVESPVQDLCMSYMQESDSKPEKLGDGIDEYIDYLMNNEIKSVGIPTGMKIYDECIGGGLRRKGVNLIGARPKTGKSVMADCVALSVSRDLKIPVLMLDTEMAKKDHHHRMLANLSRIEINNIEKGKFKYKQADIDKVLTAAKTIKDMPYSYINVSLRSFDEILSIIKRWIFKEVGFDENGNVNDCLVIFDYFKMMSADGISNNMAEFQVLGFQITQLHNFCVEHDCACLAFVQLNRDGITKETTDVASGSDRLIWLCTSFSIFKEKTPEEVGMDGPQNGNRKLIPIASRYGPGIGDNGYICLSMEGEFASLKELSTVRRKLPDEEPQQSNYGPSF